MAGRVVVCFLILITVTCLFVATGDKPGVDMDKVEYAKGSVCQYCDYCKVNNQINNNNNNSWIYIYINIYL